ncbi:MAG: hypothetical protein ABIB79_01270 [archaeon]
MRCRDLIHYVALTAIVTAGMLEGIQYFVHKPLMKKGEEIAVRQYGDRKASFTEAERNEWYESMNVEDWGPSLYKLNKYVNANEK